MPKYLQVVKVDTDEIDMPSQKDWRNCVTAKNSSGHVIVHTTNIKGGCELLWPAVYAAPSPFKPAG